MKPIQAFRWVIFVSIAFALAACSSGGGGNGGNRSALRANQGGYYNPAASNQLLQQTSATQSAITATSGGGSTNKIPDTSNTAVHYDVQTFVAPPGSATSTGSGDYYLSQSGPSTSYSGVDHTINQVTGAVTRDGHLYYTDAHDDPYLNYLRAQIDQLDNKTIVETTHQLTLQAASKLFSASISDVRAFVTQEKTVGLDLTFQYDDNASNTITVQFTGNMTNGRSTDMAGELTQTSNPVAGSFQARAVCLDADASSCDNVLFIVEQGTFNTNGVFEACKRAYIIQRLSNPSLEFSEQAQHEYKACLDTTGAGGYGVCSHPELATFIEYSGLGARSDYEFKRNNHIAAIPYAPIVNKIQLRTWTVAYGPARLELALRGDPATTDPLRNVTVFSSPLNAPGFSTGFISRYQGPLQIFSSSENVNEPNRFISSPVVYDYKHLVDSAYLTHNNGKGFLEFHFVMWGKQSSLDISATADLHQVVAPETIANWLNQQHTVTHTVVTQQQTKPAPAPAPEKSCWDGLVIPSKMHPEQDIVDIFNACCDKAKELARDSKKPLSTIVPEDYQRDCVDNQPPKKVPANHH